MVGRVTSCNANMYLQGQCNGTTDTDTARCVDCFPPPNKCAVGMYFSSTCKCSYCQVQPRDCTGSTPVYNGCEGYGIQDNAACLDSSYNCGPVCAEGLEYQDQPCMPGLGARRSCAPCEDTLLEVREAIDNGLKYVASPCTLFQNAVILPCTPQQECPRNHYWSKCTPIRDGMCIPCTGATCELGMFLSQCYPDRDAECLSCTASVQCTEPETYRTECRRA